MKNTLNYGVLAAVIFVIAVYLGFEKTEKPTSHQKDQNAFIQNNENLSAVRGLERIRKAYERQERDVPVQAQGMVKAVLRDDNDGSRHQKFILKLDNGLSVLVAHNIDLAPKITNLQKGDLVEFKGDYEYNDKGGVIHWTHHDPHSKHQDGWLKMDGKIYQ
nr:DUF3465 domain-containing protein [Acinetobacter sp. Marseille-Q1620]